MKKSILTGGLQTWAALALFLSAATSSCSSKTRPMPPPLKKQAHQLKVLTYNVNWGGADMAGSADTIKKTGADVVALQETTPRWERFLRNRLATTYPHQRYLTMGGAGGMAFLSKHPLARFKRLRPPTGGWFPGWSVLVKTPLGSVRVLNVHLRPPLKANGGVSGVPSAYYSTKAIRRKQLANYLAALPGAARTPVIVMGDFNESDSGRALQLAKRRGFANALAKFDTSTPTWRWPTSLYTFTSRLDHILHTKNLRCDAAQVLGDGGSDHRPVEAVFALNEENRRSKK